MMMTNAPQIDVAIIGAGPYGLSIAAHLRASKLKFRIFGQPMSSWRNSMAAGTMLKSFGCASSLYDPGSTYTLNHYYQEHGLAYSDDSLPIPLETFISYGLQFQKRLVPELEEIDIISVAHTASGFTLVTAAGETLTAKRVILAVGITHFDYTPALFADLPSTLVSHSSQYRVVTGFSGQRVAVVGAGASAADIAGLLHEAGAEVHMIVRNKEIHFHAPPSPGPRPLTRRVLTPRSGLGYGWRGRLCTEYPLAFHAMPQKFRHYAVHSVNGPAPHWITKNKVVGHVAMHLGSNIEAAQAVGDGLDLVVRQQGGTAKSLHVDHLITATGYKADLARLSFLEPKLRSVIRSSENSPILNTNFESSVRGLYMVGLASANSFGPLCRFAYGAKFTSRRIANHLARTA